MYRPDAADRTPVARGLFEVFRSADARDVLTSPPEL